MQAAMFLRRMSAWLVTSRVDRHAPSYRDVLLEDELLPHLRAIAAREQTAGYVRMRSPKALVGQFTQGIGLLNRAPTVDQLPAAAWLSDNGRFLQEEAASLSMELRACPGLPRDSAGHPRILVLARELMGHRNAELELPLLRIAVEEWQQVAPLCEPEIAALPLALKATLMELLGHLMLQTLQDQMHMDEAAIFVRLLSAGKTDVAAKRLSTLKQSGAFVVRLLSLLRESEDAASLRWLEVQLGAEGGGLEALVTPEHERQAEARRWTGNAITSLRLLSRVPWHRELEEMSLLHHELCRDRVYLAMDEESRAYYRARTVRLSRQTNVAELMIARAALALSQAEPEESVSAHVGYYLLDEGRLLLLDRLPDPTARARGYRYWQRHSFGLYRLSLWLGFAALLLAAWALALPGWLWLPFAVSLLHPLRQALDALLRRFCPPKMVPRLKLQQLPNEYRTLVVCPTMLQSREHAIHMVKQLSILQQANPDPNLHFLLLGDFQDSLTGTLTGDEEIVSAAAAATQTLCEASGHPFYYMQRERVLSAQDAVYMSRERKRGGLETLLKLLCGRPIEDSFTYCSCPKSALVGQYRYVITLDSDTFLPPGAALRLVGAMAHPLQQRQIFREKMRGVSILQPRMEIAAHTVATPLCRLHGGSGGTDPYNALVSDLMQSLLRRGSFVGKGIIDPAAFLDATLGKVLPGSVLSHDLLEGELGGCSVATDITLYDGQPATLRGFLLRLHRWTRGDWQLLPYVVPFLLPTSRRPEHSLDAVSRHKIWDNLLRSLTPALRLALIVGAVGCGNGWLLALALISGELCVLWPVSLPTLSAALTRLLALPAEALMQLDAIGRTLYRVLYSRHHLLEWTTAAQLSVKPQKPSVLVLSLNVATSALTAALSLLSGALLWPGIAVAALWALFPAVLPLLEQPAPTQKPISEFMRGELMQLAKSTFRFFEVVVDEQEHFLPPDNLQIDPEKGVAHRTSPTNIGLYLTALVSARELDLLTPTQAAARMEKTVSTLEKLEKWYGLFYNWYDTLTLQALPPKVVSSVDCGNLAACLLCAAQAVRTWLNELPPAFLSLSGRLDALANAMQLHLLYDGNAELFYITLIPDQPDSAKQHYDLLASEARLLSFTAILLGQAPVRHWYRLGRSLTRTHGGKTLVSYSGTMFEYLMPQLFLPSIPHTLLARACAEAVREQRRFSLGGAWGISECGYYAFDPSLSYQYRAFGVPTLALDPSKRSSVLAPYASMLALSIAPKHAFRNLQRMRSQGWEGPMGLFEAIDFGKERVGEDAPYRVVRSHMAHHQGMILAALCNLLCADALSKLFFSLPRAQAHTLLLEEKPLMDAKALRHPLKRTESEARLKSLLFSREAQPLFFPVDAHALHGAGTTVMIDAQGGGYISHRGVMLTRFRESCIVPSGPRFYLRDSQSGALWQACDPLCAGDTRFETAQAVFHRVHQEVESELRVFVNPLDGAALHLLTLKNRSSNERMLEICSYLELSLAPFRDDRAHPAFQNLFIVTQLIGRTGVMATRRPRADGEKPRVLVHTLAADVAPVMRVAQTDRAAFLGRGHTVYEPLALTLPISGQRDAVGNVIEPCLSLRMQFVLSPHGQAQFVFSTALKQEQDTPLALSERYTHPESAQRAYELAKTLGLVTVRYLGLTPAMMHTVSRLSGCLLYTGQPHQQLHAQPSTLKLDALWALGISGDLPILTVFVRSTGEQSTVKLLLKAHAYYRLSGFWFDLVLICEQRKGFAESLPDEARGWVTLSPSRDVLGKAGGVFVLDRAQLSADQVTLLRRMARLVLSGGGQSLADQLEALQQPARPTSAPITAPIQQKPLAKEELLLDNGFGGFNSAGDYVIRLQTGQSTPAPWSNVIAFPHFGSVATESGLAFTWAENSHQNRLTRWPGDNVTLHGEENFFLQEEGGAVWSATRWPLGMSLAYRVTHAPGVTVYESSPQGLDVRLTVLTDPEHPVGLRQLILKNETKRPRTLIYTHTVLFSLSDGGSAEALTATWREGNTLYAHNPAQQGLACLRPSESDAVALSMSAGAFWGLGTAVPLCTMPEGGDTGPQALLRHTLTLEPNESRTVLTLLGFCATREALDRATDTILRDGAALRLHLCRQYWEQVFSALRFDVPDPALALMLNRYLPYQVRASRLFARAGFYQAGGAYGFRDQLQDVLALVYTEPATVRAHLLRCAAHQFTDGDVQHWWHEPRMGVRTRISDDKLFLPYVAATYVQITGDTGALHELIPYLRAPLLESGEHEQIGTPESTEEKETLLAHCLRAMRHCGYGPRGLLLMGGGDWNDGMNRVGGEKGESVWLSMFFCETLRKLLPFCDDATRASLAESRLRVLSALDQHAWDGRWYLRAWYDDGAPLGSARNAECRIDTLPQSWAVLCGLNRERCTLAMEQLWQQLYEPSLGILKLFTPPFDGIEKPGYIAGYVPGVRENGGQYTHAVSWAIAALHQLGQDDRAWELTLAALPINHADTQSKAMRYRVEPYVMAGDVYAAEGQAGRGGWTWYTGSAAWLYTVVLEQLFGLQKVGNTLRLRPSIPESWDGLSLSYRFGSATYHLHASKDCPFPVADGEKLADGTLTLRDDGRIHEATFPIRSLVPPPKP